MQTLTIETLGQLDDEAVGQQINAALIEAVTDLDQRGSDGKPRKVAIEVIFTKPDGKVSQVDVKVGIKKPPYTVNPTVGETEVRRGQACFTWDQDDQGKESA